MEYAIIILIANLVLFFLAALSRIVEIRKTWYEGALKKYEVQNLSAKKPGKFIESDKKFNIRIEIVNIVLQITGVLSIIYNIVLIIKYSYNNNPATNDTVVTFAISFSTTLMYIFLNFFLMVLKSYNNFSSIVFRIFDKRIEVDEKVLQTFEDIYKKLDDRNDDSVK